ncbi:MAG: fumarylacetoacetate hydrolase family protein [Acidimicrobiales bacterium]|jgi:acylpyruvate hydrolase
MRLATVRTADGTHAARQEGDRLLLLPDSDVGALLASRRPAAALEDVLTIEPTGELALAEAHFAPLVPHPEKIICVGLNYRAHILEMSRELPSHPTLFAKFASGLLGAYDDLVLPAVSKAVDWEVELGVVIGRTIRRATPAEARKAIAGYTVVNDVSMRDWQNRTTQYLQGKAFDSSTPVGPVLVTGDEIGEASDLEVRCEVNGTVMQRGRTSDLLFDPPTIVSYISQFATLVPGDLISTGTPEGVGSGRSPQVFLAPGQVLRTAVEGIGSCVNRCVEEIA